jgi:hypothetical protein
MKLYFVNHNYYKMSSCIVCNNKSTKQIFDCCKVRLHTKCVSSYLDKFSMRKCPTCNKKTKYYKTRFNDKEDIFVQKVKCFLGKLNNISMSDTDARKLIILDMFEYISKNTYFFSKNENFKQVVKKKLTEFYVVDEWTEANTIYHRLFKSYIKV